MDVKAKAAQIKEKFKAEAAEFKENPKEKIADLAEKSKICLPRFFASRYYPPFVCALVLLGYFTGLELLFGSINILIFC